MKKKNSGNIKISNFNNNIDDKSSILPTNSSTINPTGNIDNNIKKDAI